MWPRRNGSELPNSDPPESLSSESESATRRGSACSEAESLSLRAKVTFRVQGFRFIVLRLEFMVMGFRMVLD